MLVPGTVLNMFFCVFNVVTIILTMYCNVICTGLPLRLFSTLVFFWKRHVILRGSRIVCIVFNCWVVPYCSSRFSWSYIRTDSVDSWRNCCERIIEGGFIEDWINVRYCFVPRLI